MWCKPQGIPRPLPVAQQQTTAARKLTGVGEWAELCQWAVEGGTIEKRGDTASHQQDAGRLSGCRSYSEGEEERAGGEAVGIGPGRRPTNKRHPRPDRYTDRVDHRVERGRQQEAEGSRSAIEGGQGSVLTRLQKHEDNEEANRGSRVSPSELDHSKWEGPRVLDGFLCQ